MLNDSIFNRWRQSIRLGLAAGLILLVTATSPVLAYAAGAAPAQPQMDDMTTPSLDDTRDLEAFMDGIMTSQLDAHHIPGAMVSVVKDGEVIFARGYGYADLATFRPVEADRTIFHPGSVSKLFTWTAVMQLVEQGKLDLDTDINTYLDFTIPATYSKPITLRNLMTHTPGFEDRGIGIFAASAEEMLTLSEFLPDNIPARVYPPGETTAYSNYGTALAGYIVERMSGKPFEQYIEENILQPLDMQHSTFLQRDFPSALAGDVAVGYTYANGAFQAGYPEYLNVPPAGALSSTATDMANFMIAYLQGGQYGESRILQEETVQEMFRRQFANDPVNTGFGLGFYEIRSDNPRIVGHEGDTLYFHTLLALIPEHQVGLYVSYNGGGVDGLAAWAARRDLLEAFLDRYYPAEKSPAPFPSADFLSRASRFAGSYASTRSNYTSTEKSIGLFQSLTVSPMPEGTLLASYGPIVMQLVEVGPLEFQNVEDGSKVVFQENENGQIVSVTIDWDPTEKFVLQPWYASSSVHLSVLVICLLLFAVGIIGWPIRLVEERSAARAAGQVRPLLPRLARWTGFAMGLLNVIFAFWAVALLNTISASPFGIPPAMPAVMSIPVVTALLTLGMVVFSVLAWKERYWRLGGRLFYTLVTLTSVLFIVLVNYWHLWVIGQG